MPVSDFDHVYQAQTHAIHLYDYTAKFCINDREYDLKPGDITFSPAGMDSAYQLARPGGHWCIHFFLPARGGPIQNLPLYMETGARAGYYRDRFKAIATLHHRGSLTENQQQVFKARAAAIFLELVLSLFTLQADAIRTRQRYSDHAMEKLLAHMENHLGEPLNVPALAKKVGLSQNYLAALFRRTFSMSIQQHLMLRRMESARHLLQTTSATVKVIGGQVGIPDAQHFNKCFRRSTGVSPSRFREESR
jgi:AraC-like DNA-binding protein